MNSHKEANDSLRVESIRKRQDAIANEIVSLHYSFAKALSLVNNTNAVEFPTIVKPLSNRLREVFSELDALGPFPLFLRESTLKQIEDDGQLILKEGRDRPSNPWTTESDSIITPIVTEFFEASNSVTKKAGLFYTIENGTNTATGIPLKR